MFGSAIKKKVAIIIGMDTKEVDRHVDIIKNKLKSLRSFAKKAFIGISIAGTVATGIFTMIAKKVFETGRQFESFRVQLNTLYKDAKKGQEAFDWVKQFAKTTPFELPELVQANIMLKAFGLEARNVMKDIGDLAAGMQVPLEFVVDAFGRLRAGQTGEAFEKLRRLGITTGKLMAEGIQFGAGGQLIDKTDKGLKRAVGAVQKIIRRDFGGLMEESSKTMDGMLSNISDVITQFMGKLADRVFPTIKKDVKALLDYITDLLDSGKLDEFSDEFKKKFLEVYYKFKKNLPEIIEWIKTAAKEIWEALKFLWEWKEEIVLVIAFTKALKIVKEIYAVTKSIAALTGMGKGVAMAGGAGAVSGVGAVAAAASAPALLGYYKGTKAKSERVESYATLAEEYIKATTEDELKEVKDKIASAEHGWFDKATLGFPSAQRARGSDLPKMPVREPSTGREKNPYMPVITEDIEKRRNEYQKMLADEEKLEKEHQEKLASMAEKGNKNTDLDGSIMGAEKSENEIQLEKEAYLAKLGLLNEYNKKRVAIEQTYIKNVDSVKKSSIIKTEEERARVLDQLKEKRANDLAQNVEDNRGASQLELAIMKQKFDIELGLMNTHKQLIAENNLWYLEQVQSVVEDETLTIFDKNERIIALEEALRQKLKDINDKKYKDEIKYSKAQMKAQELTTKFLYGIESTYVGNKIGLHKAAAASIIQLTGDEVKGYLKEKAIQWAADAVAAAAAMRWGSAAQYAAAAAMAGAGVALVGEAQRSLTDELMGRDDDINNDVLSSNNSEAQSMTVGAGSTGQPTNVYISPTVSINGETIFIGEGNVDELESSLGQMIINVINDAFDDGEISI